ncbi:MAG: PIN domain-containing protein [Thermoanaerobaculia bacterium]
MRTDAVDAKVFVSFFVERHEAQRAAARALLLEAEEGEIAAMVPQSVVFEISYVLQSQYGLTGERLAAVVRAVIAFPGVQVVDECSWKRVFEVWPTPLTSLADAAFVAVATSHHYDAIATFDQKLVKRSKDLGVASYW